MDKNTIIETGATHVLTNSSTACMFVEDIVLKGNMRDIKRQSN